MAIYFLDSSAVVKLYLSETGIEWMRAALTDPVVTALVVSDLTRVEVLAALARRSKNDPALRAGLDDRIEEFLANLRDRFTTIELDRQLIDYAASVARQCKLRAADSIQLATALAARASSIMKDRLLW